MAMILLACLTPAIDNHIFAFFVNIFFIQVFSCILNLYKFSLYIINVNSENTIYKYIFLFFLNKLYLFGLFFYGQIAQILTIKRCFVN